MGLFGGIGKIFGGITKIFSGIGDIAKLFGGILNSPLGKLLTAAFPPLAVASGVLNFAGMMGDLAGQIGGGASY